ncbi:MAG: GFA family protein [Eubacteriales bacterium]
MKYKGSCLCEEVTFEIEGEFENFFLCHCERCRKDTGSAHAANLFSSTASLVWLSGEDKIKTFDFKSEGHIKSFCTICGSALPNMQLDGKLLVVPAGSLDSDIHIKPDGHIYLDKKANWDDDLEKAPKYGELPGEKNN